MNTMKLKINKKDIYDIEKLGIDELLLKELKLFIEDTQAKYFIIEKIED